MKGYLHFNCETSWGAFRERDWNWGTLLCTAGWLHLKWLKCLLHSVRDRKEKTERACNLCSQWLVCVRVCERESAFVSVHSVCHLLGLQVAPPRADVVDASSHPAPSPVPRVWHTTYRLRNPSDSSLRRRWEAVSEDHSLLVCFKHRLISATVWLCLQQEQLEELPFHPLNFINANPPKGHVIYNKWLACHYRLPLRWQDSHLT